MNYWVMIAQVPDATPDQLSDTLIGLAAFGTIIAMLVAIAVGIKKLFYEKGPESQQYVTREALDQLRESFHGQENYTHRSIHELRDAVNAMSLGLTEVRTEMRLLPPLLERFMERMDIDARLLDRKAQVIEKLAGLLDRRESRESRHD